MANQKATMVRSNKHIMAQTHPTRVDGWSALLGNLRLVVLDLDGVLWLGSLLENGQEVQPDRDMIEHIRLLHERGILLAVVSRNNRVNVESQLAGLHVRQFLSDVCATFHPKALVIKKLVDRYRVTASNTLFVDDTFEERKEVLKEIPGIIGMEPEEAKAFFTRYLDERHLPISVESTYRSEHYLREAERGLFNDTDLSDLASFVVSSNLTVYLSQARFSELDRLVELYTRTHRLNFANRIKNREDLRRELASDTTALLTIKVVDRYGPYGIVGSVTLTRGEGTALVEDMILSCRAQGRMIEYAVIMAILKHLWADDCRKCCLNYVESPFNTHLSEVLTELGFSRNGFGKNLWSIDAGKAADNNRIGERMVFPPVHWDEVPEASYSGIPFIRRRIEEWGRKYEFKGPIVSIGCGFDELPGHDWVKTLGSSGSTGRAIRIDKLDLDGVDILGDAERLYCIADDSISTAVCLDVLEHTPNPWNVISTLLRILRPNGMLLVSAPCLIGVHEAPDDLWRFTPSGLKHLIVRAEAAASRYRFSVLECSVEGYPVYPIRTFVLAQKESRA